MKKNKRFPSAYYKIHIWFSVLSILLFVIIVIGGIGSGVEVYTISMRALIVVLGVKFIARLIISVSKSFEES
jgi:hypothetical protein